MKIAGMRAALVGAVLTLGLFGFDDGLVAPSNAQTRTPAEQEQNRRYRELDGAYRRDHPSAGAPTPGTGSQVGAGDKLKVNFVAGFGASSRIDNAEWLENRRCNFAGQEITVFDNKNYLTRARIVEEIQRSDIFFFSGHAGQASESPGMHVLIGSPRGQTGWVTSVDVQRGLHGRQGPRLVIVNGCKTTDLADGVPARMRMSSAFGITDQTVGRAYLGWPKLIPGTLADDEIGRMLTIWTTPGADGQFPTLEQARVKQGIDALTIVGDRNLRYQPPASAGSSAPAAGTYRMVAQCSEPPANVDLLAQALTNLPKCPRRDLGPECFQAGYSVRKDGIAATTFLAREPAAGSERTDVRAVAWLDQASANRDFKSSFDSFKTKKPREQHWAFESFAVAGQPDTGAMEVSLDSRFGGEAREAGRANGVFMCGKVVGSLKMFISAGSGASGKALVDATRAQMKGLLQQIGTAVRANGACGAS